MHNNIIDSTGCPADVQEFTLPSQMIYRSLMLVDSGYGQERRTGNRYLKRRTSSVKAALGKEFNDPILAAGLGWAEPDIRVRSSRGGAKCKELTA